MNSLASLGEIPTGKISKLKKDKTLVNEKELEILKQLDENPENVFKLMDKKSHLNSLLSMGMVEKSKNGLPLTEKGRKYLSSLK